MRLLIISLLIVGVAAMAGFAAVGGGDIIYKTKHVGDVLFSHDSHVENYNISCETCHDGIFPLSNVPPIRKADVKLKKKKACGVCHNGKNAFNVRDNCYVCHSAPRR